MFWIFPTKPVRTDEGFFSRMVPSEWTMERKLDGFRAILVQDGLKTKIFSRDKTELELSSNLKEQIKCLNFPDGTVLDGELWNHSLRGSWQRGVPGQISFWDVIAIQGRWMGQRPIEERRRILTEILTNKARIQTPDILIESHTEASKEVYDSLKRESAKSQFRNGGVHGVVLKKVNSFRHDHVKRSVEHADWLKIVWRT